MAASSNEPRNLDSAAPKFGKVGAAVRYFDMGMSARIIPVKLTEFLPQRPFQIVSVGGGDLAAVLYILGGDVQGFQEISRGDQIGPTQTSLQL